MADGSTMKMQSAGDISRLVGRMFDLPANLISWEVFRDAFEKHDGKAGNPADAREAHRAFVQDPSSCPEHVIEFCRKALEKN